MHGVLPLWLAWFLRCWHATVRRLRREVRWSLLCSGPLWGARCASLALFEELQSKLGDLGGSEVVGSEQGTRRRAWKQPTHGWRRPREQALPTLPRVRPGAAWQEGATQRRTPFCQGTLCWPVHQPLVTNKPGPWPRKLAKT